MAKWKCGICGSNFENFHAQGFNNKIYCPLCYFKKENQELKKQVEEYQKDIKDLDNQNKRAFENMQLNQLKVCNMKKQQKEFIKWLENGIEKVKNTEFLDEKIQRAGLIAYNRCLQKYKSIIGGK